MTVTVKTLQTGATKPSNNPYTICIVANPCLEAPWQSGQFIVDPIMANQAGFDQAVRYVLDSLLGRLPGQKELAFAPLAAQFRVVSIFDNTLSCEDLTSLVAQDYASNIIVARQPSFAPFLARYAIQGVSSMKADVAYAISASNTHSRSSAWYTHDNNGGTGVSFTLDGASLSHRFDNIHPGTVALHLSANSLVALHEFGHAASSWTNGSVTDLYVDNNSALNNKRGRPIPAQFGTMNAVSYVTDGVRDHLGYPTAWLSYHCQLNDPAFPAVMDDFWLASTQPEDCQHDRKTRQFLLDRISAIMSRP